MQETKISDNKVFKFTANLIYEGNSPAVAKVYTKRKIKAIQEVLQGGAYTHVQMGEQVLTLAEGLRKLVGGQR